MQTLILAYLICMNISLDNDWIVTYGKFRYSEQKVNKCVKEKALCLDQSKDKDALSKCLEK